jgi:hypothetical protein|tara:strand:- start:769 stop:1197 length:429 start_codon:yes stop_codon:yes gene_type:complete
MTKNSTAAGTTTRFRTRRSRAELDRSSRDDGRSPTPYEEALMRARRAKTTGGFQAMRWNGAAIHSAKATPATFRVSVREIFRIRAPRREEHATGNRFVVRTRNAPLRVLTVSMTGTGTTVGPVSFPVTTQPPRTSTRWSALA